MCTRCCRASLAGAHLGLGKEGGVLYVEIPFASGIFYLFLVL